MFTRKTAISSTVDRWAFSCKHELKKKIQKLKLSGKILASCSGKAIKWFTSPSALYPIHVSWTSNLHIWDWKEVLHYYDDIIILDLQPWNQFLEHFQTAECLSNTYFQAVVLTEKKNKWLLRIVCARHQSVRCLPKHSMPFEHVQGGGRPVNSLYIKQHAR